MTKMKLAAMLGVATQLTVFSAVAYADGFAASTLKVYAADPLDVARVANGRLRKTRYEESNEQAVVKLLGDGNNGVYVQMQSGAITDAAGVKTQPVHRQQLACTPFKMVAAADGTVSAQVTGPAKFITDNVGQDYRNANFPAVYPVNGGTHMAVLLNYRPQGTNDTNRYVKVVDSQCNLVPVQNAAGQVQKQVLIMHKNNDNCDQSQTGEQGGDVASDAGGSTHLTLWAGCNGNGQDDGWINDVTISAVNNGAAFKVVKNFDASLEPQEERTRGRCSVADSDPNTAICTWTAGNNQPCREGTWIGAVDIGPNGAKGENAQSRVLWKKMIGGQKIIGGQRTYSVRANSSRVLVQAADGSITRSDMLFVTSDDLRGTNTNNKKGGRYLQQNMGVAQATKAGLKWIVPMTDVTNQMLGIDATHLTMAATLVEDGAKILPAMTFAQGSQNGAAGPADIKILALDATAGKFIDYGSHLAGGTYDRHLYSNYLGGNPGNQGRNFAGAQFISTAKITGITAAAPKFALLHALTGKDPTQAAMPEIKQTGYVSIMPMRNPQAAPPPPAGAPNTTAPGTQATGGGQNAQPEANDPTPANQLPSDPGTASTPGNFSSGCSMASGDVQTSGFFFLLLGVGIVALARRRRA
ncbi:MAG: hypothetical protein JWN44_2334 [Myxococcales bacterium]|nr:hypothetical protein [Myxococcales bacterium]